MIVVALALELIEYLNFRTTLPAILSKNNKFPLSVTKYKKCPSCEAHKFEKDSPSSKKNG